MNEDRYTEVKELFAAARERPQEERDVFLDEACGTDAELRREVQSLLAYDAESTRLRSSDTKTFVEEERFPPGTVLAGRYRVAGRLGRGGMGELYRAEDALLGVPVALKLLPAALAEDVGRLSLLLNEVRLARTITHPNVCRIHDVGEQEGLHFISMELIAGEDLAARLRRASRLTREEALRVARGLCAGLDAAHAQGVLHRDLKPANLLLDERGDLHIADFGLSLDIGGGPARAWPQAGTPAYMAPEQQAGGEVSVRTDLYAAGLVLYEVFTGRQAFSASSLEELARLHREEAPTPPSEIVADLDPAIEKVILRCLEKDPRRRPSSARAVASALPGRLELAEGTQLRTLVMSDLADRTRLVESLGDSRAAELSERHELVFGDLVREHGGREIDVPATLSRGGRLLLFERPIHAVLFAHAYHRALAELSAEPALADSSASGATLEARLAVHLGEVVLRREADSGPAGSGPAGSGPAGGGPLRAEGLATLLVARLTSLAGGRQTLLTRGAFDVARRGAVDEAERAGRLSWLAHGRYLIQGMAEGVEVFEVGEPGQAPLRPPEDSPEARRIYDEDVLTGWRPAAGRSLPGRAHWTIDRKLGEGGFGEVWLAVHRKTRERRVLKFCFETSRLRGLQREITLFRLLKEKLGERDDIGRILDWNFDEPPFFIESEYTAGGNLEEWAAARGGIGEVPLAERLEIVAQVAEALAAAHSVGVLHKDVKPSNVLMWRDAEGRAKAQLTDFGIGAVTERERLSEAGITVLGLTETSRGDSSSDAAGTRLYMAPELIEGRSATVQTDVYALGVMLYQLVAGDLRRALAPGWRRDVADELLCEDVAAAVDGDPERRLSSAADLGRRLRTLSERRAERARRSAEHVGPYRLPQPGRAVGRVTARTAKAAVTAMLAAVLVGAWWWLRDEGERSAAAVAEQAQPKPRKIMLAVLPLASASTDPDQEYFIDGLTQEMIAHLGGLRPDRLGVIARTSSMRYKATEKTIGEIGRELGVDYLVEGSVRRERDSVRIIATLVKVSDQTQLWTNTFERKLSGVFALQNEIAAHIARSLALELLPSASTPAVHVDPLAYEAYSKGWYYWNQLSSEALEKSIEQFQRAIEIDGDFAPAYQGLAAAYHLQASSSRVPDKDAYPKAKKAVLRALELDDTLAEAHASLGFIAYYFDWDWAAAERSFQRALELDPASAHHTYAIFLRGMGRTAESVAHMRQAVLHDPLSVLAKANLGYSLMAARDYDAAIGQFRGALEMKPGFLYAQCGLAASYRWSGRRDEAVAAYGEVAEIIRRDTTNLWAGPLVELGTYYAASGRREDALEILARLKRESERRYVPPARIALLYAALGEADPAMALLERAYEEREDDLAQLNLERRWDGLRSDPRFQDLVLRMDFPP